MTFNLHLFGFFVILLSSTEIFSQKVKTFVDYRKEAEAIIKAIPEVKIEGPEIDVAKFTGTVPDEPGSFDFRAGIQKAIDELSAKGGGRVLLSHPEGPDAWINL